jgi:hypothetical protein
MKTMSLKTVCRATSAGVALAALNLAAATVYVSLDSPNPSPPYATWATAAHVIQDAVDAASPGDTVLVTNGVYAAGGIPLTHNPESVFGRVLITNSITLVSVNGPQVTTTIAGKTWTNAVGALESGGGRCVYLGTNAVLSGFTLTGGSGRVADGSVFSIQGGGVWAVPTAIVTNCIITGNSASEGGGSFGGTLDSCLVRDNSATWGGGVAGGSLNNCTVVQNTALYGGGVINVAGFGCSLTNCIVYGNEGGNYVTNAIKESFEYSCTSPLPPYGAGNIDADPGFADAAAGDFRLRPDSPCIDTGTNLTELLTTDILGLPRPLDGNGDGIARYDMVAFEFNPYRFGPVLRPDSTGFSFTVHGEPGKSVRIERSRDLASWEYVATVPIPPAVQTLIEPAAASESFLFYRAVSVP